MAKLDENKKEISLKDFILKQMPKELQIGCEEENSQLVIYARPENIARLLYFLRDNAETQFKQLIDVFGVDYPERDKRFEIVYNLLSLKFNKRIYVKLQTNEATPIPSVCKIYSNANWYEREVWDMYGVKFKDHPDLRRILTDYGFEGHPQRKDFPLTGYVEVEYDENKERVVYKPVHLHQDYRSFDYLSPWEGTDYVLPGDEKAS